MSAQWDRVTALFDAARLLGPAERAIFLAAACDGDAALRGEIESLLQNDAPDSFLAHPASDPLVAAARHSVATPEIGQVLSNRYRIEARMATGGQAIVFRALDEVLARSVVVKVLRLEGRQDGSLQSVCGRK